ncbi:MAG: acyloxyacyl hydrolase [Desulfarculales bacterium]|jgi:hypothetical protein|nr:acyloxyacyl hydrolase [Desulfarculales bacterium]
MAGDLMRKGLMVKILVSALLLTVNVGLSRAAETSLSLSVAAGDSSSLAYDLSLQQIYDPWIANEYITLRPLLGLTAFMWHNNNDSLGGGMASVGLRMSMGSSAVFRPYLAATFGPALLSQTSFDDIDLGSALQFRSQGILGISFGPGLRHSIQASFSHYSNAGLSDENSGYNTWGLSYGFTF